MSLIDDLNDQQRAAVEATDGPLLIIAGPGTGKTKTLTARIVHLISSGRAQPQEILALTFTKKAAEEMRSRVAALLGGHAPTASAPTIATFHALCHELLNQELTFVNDAQRLQILKSLKRPTTLKSLSTRELGLHISCAKNQPSIDDADIAAVVRAYNDALAGANMVDFDDLLVNLRDHLQTDDVARTAIQARFKHILVDEFQDTNSLQYQLLQLLCGHENLCVIGDPLQSIYGFRGASGDIFDRFRHDFPAHQAITLTTNYRSVPEVVRVSNALFADAPDLHPHTEQSGIVRTVQVLNEYSEATWIVNEIQRAIGGGDFLQAVSDDQQQDHRRLNDFAILYRSRAVARAVQNALADSGLPFQVVGEGSPYDSPQVQAVIVLLRAAATGEAPELEGFSSAQQHLLKDALHDAHHAVPSALAQKIIAILGFEQTALQQLINTLVRFETLSAAIAFFDTIAEQAFYDPSADAITLLTIHASKGLEFPHVFLVGAEEGVLPHERADVAEEKRLFYVAVTRAKERMDILHTVSRGGHPSQLSSFAAQLAQDVLPKSVDPHLADDQRRARKRQIKRSQQTLF